MSLVQFLQLLVSLGPQLVAVFNFIAQLVNQINSSGRARASLNSLDVCTANLSGEEVELLNQIATLHDSHVGLRASRFSITDVLKVYAFIKAHPEMLEHVKAIIADVKAIVAFFAPAPAPQPQPNHNPPNDNPPADNPPAAI
jgi:hypothetical protein